MQQLLECSGRLGSLDTTILHSNSEIPNKNLVSCDRETRSSLALGVVVGAVDLTIVL